MDGAETYFPSYLILGPDCVRPLSFARVCSTLFSEMNIFFNGGSFLFTPKTPPPLPLLLRPYFFFAFFFSPIHYTYGLDCQTRFRVSYAPSSLLRVLAMFCLWRGVVCVIFFSRFSSSFRSIVNHFVCPFPPPASAPFFFAMGRSIWAEFWLPTFLLFALSLSTKATNKREWSSWTIDSFPPFSFLFLLEITSRVAKFSLVVVTHVNCIPPLDHPNPSAVPPTLLPLPAH